jgi:predicted secreted protein
MRTHASIIAITGLLFLVTLITGLVQSQNLRANDPRLSEKPLAGAIFNVHKLVALATLITAAVAIRRLHRGIAFTGIELAAVIIAGLFFLLMFVSGGLLSLGRPRSDELLAVHKVFSVLTGIPTFGAIYLLTRGRW